ncbi:hypothetical protein AAXB25_29835 [Paenibacillus lautus]|uniref:hypothetical protein n=1 Tax=Paenibacillus lautus TaxID=1401 RepID=UPI003D2C0648
MFTISFKAYDNFDEIKQRYSQWKESIISIVSFVEEVTINASKLLNFISVLNPQLLESENIKVLENKMHELSLYCFTTNEPTDH